MTFNLLGLPDELLPIVASHLHFYWLKKFRLTCRRVEKAIHREVLRQLFSHRDIYLDNERQLEPLRLLVLDPVFGPALKTITFHIWALDEFMTKEKDGIASFFAALSQRTQQLEICVRLRECVENRFWEEENYVLEYYEWIHRHASPIGCIPRCPTLSICSPQWRSIPRSSLYTPGRLTLFRGLASLASSADLEIVYRDQPSHCGLSYSKSRAQVVTTGLLPSHAQEIAIILLVTGND